MRINLLNQIFNNLQPVEHVGQSKHGQALWRCICLACKREDYITQGSWIKAGRVKSCGCNHAKSRHSGLGIALRNKCIDQTKRNAKVRNIAFTLTDAQCIKLFQQNCYYCDSQPSMIRKHTKSVRDLGGLRSTDEYRYNGIDRLDPNLSYVIDNCVAACIHCNMFKNDQSFNEFKERITRVKRTLSGEKMYVPALLDASRLEQKVQTRPDRNEKLIRTQLEYGVASRNALLAHYKKGAKTRKYSWDLSLADFIKLTQGNCYYCQLTPSSISKLDPAFNGPYIYNGIDRLDNTLGYLTDNCVSCCKYCNKAKNDLLQEQFICHIYRIFNHLEQWKTK